MTMLDNPTAPSGVRDAYARIQSVLQQYDLQALSSFVWDGLVSGASEQAMAVDIYDQPAFKQRFWVIDARRAAGLPPVSPADVLNYEDSWAQIARGAGFPPSFSGRDIAQKLMAGDVSVAEAKQRVDDGFVQLTQAPPEVRNAFSTYFGHQGDNALAAFLTDPELALPDLERMVGAAQIGGRGQQHGYTIDSALAQQLARQGVSAAQAEQGFSQIDQERHLFEQTISEQAPLTAETAIEGKFGLSGTAEEQVRRVAAQRQADFSGNPGAASDQAGVTGVGQARSV